MKKKAHKPSDASAGSYNTETHMKETNDENLSMGSELEPSQGETLPVEKAQELYDRISDLEKKLAETHDKHLRLFSEFDNYRRRSSKERMDLIKTASEDVIIGILPVLDDMERAISLQAQGNAEDVDVNGISLIFNKLKTILSQKGLEEYGTPGDTFDTDLHEAVTHVPATVSDQKGKTVDILQKGYRLSGKIIRFAKVVVAS